MSLFMLPWPNMKGHLPVLTELVVKGVYFDEASTANDVMTFDTGLAAATEYAIGIALSGVPTSAWGRVRDPDVSATLRPNAATQKYCVSLETQSAATFGDVLVIGRCTLVKAASATHTAGQPFVPAVSAVGKVAACTAIGSTTFVVTAEVRPVVAFAITAGTTTTSVVCHFNGLGEGWVLVNVAYAAEPA